MNKLRHASIMLCTFVFLEISVFQRNESIDINGLMVNTLTLILILAGILLAPPTVVLGLDQISQIILTHFSSILRFQIIKFIIYVLIYTLTQWCTLEATRIYITLCISTMTICTIYLRSLKILQTRGFNMRTLLLYHQVHCINQIGMRVIGKIAGAFMAVGFILFVLGNRIILLGCNLLPIGIYVIIYSIIVSAYFVVVQTIPIAIACNEFCKGLVSKWKTSVLEHRREVKYWIKKLSAQQLISFYYALTKFERDTQVNYYFAIVNYTTNALIMF